MIIWTSEQFKKNYPSKINCIENALEKPYMTDDMIHTILDLAGIKTQEFDETRSLINVNFNSKRKRIYHNQDYDSELKI